MNASSTLHQIPPHPHHFVPDPTTPYQNKINNHNTDNIHNNNAHNPSSPTSSDILCGRAISPSAETSPFFFPVPTEQPNLAHRSQEPHCTAQLPMPPVTATACGPCRPWSPYPTITAASSNHKSSSRSSLPSCASTLALSMPLSAFMGSASSSSSSSPSSPSRNKHTASAGFGLACKSPDDVAQMLEQILMGSNKNSVLLLDMRPSVQHAMASIQTSVSMCVPNMLLKRSNYSLQMVSQQLTTEHEAETFGRWTRFEHVVFFDSAGTVPSVGSAIYFLALKFRKEGCNAELSYLKGGYDEFVRQHSKLCSFPQRASIDHARTPSSTPTSACAVSHDTRAATRTMLPPSPPRQRLHLGSLPSMMPSAPTGMPCQTPMLENPNANPLFENVRLAMGLDTNITEEIPVRLPQGFSVDPIREQLPAWLLAAVAEKSGGARLAEYFQRVEVQEKKRIALMMSPQVLRAGRTTAFSIGAGIEQGLKNRYNNIWPYDHSRVKLNKVGSGTSDYINASFLHPPFGKKSYIVTQGPMPSTFPDFWNMTWEQNSRVIVMLTREHEMGRIKCHQYWPTAQDPVMETGGLQVSFVTEFLPEKDNGTILVRQLKLRPLGQPLEEERTITQVQFSGWPDFGVPETPMEVLRVIELANEHNHPSAPGVAGPMVVHCSAGCGRTGAFCVIDSILTELKEHPESVSSQALLSRQPQKTTPLLPAPNGRPSLDMGSRSNLPNSRVATGMGSNTKHSPSSSPTKAAVSMDDPMTDAVYASVSQFREQRLSMVQTLRQYVFCYEAIFWHQAVELTSDQPELLVLPPPTTMVHTPLLQIPPPSTTGSVGSNPALSMGNAPLAPTSKEFSFFG